jgi:hypothetical protein
VNCPKHVSSSVPNSLFRLTNIRGAEDVLYTRLPSVSPSLSQHLFHVFRNDWWSVTNGDYVRSKVSKHYLFYFFLPLSTLLGILLSPSFFNPRRYDIGVIISLSYSPIVYFGSILWAIGVYRKYSHINQETKEKEIKQD